MDKKYWNDVVIDRLSEENKKLKLEIKQLNEPFEYSLKQARLQNEWLKSVLLSILNGNESKLRRKGFSRIYTDKQENIDKIKEIIRIMDEFEYDYLPDDLISVFDGKIEYVYNGKFFEIDMKELVARCESRGIFVFYVIDDKFEHVP